MTITKDFNKHIAQGEHQQPSEDLLGGITITPDPKLNKEIWEVLQHIRQQFLVTPIGKLVKYRIPNIVGAGIVSKHRRIDILYKLEEQKVLEVKRNAAGTRIGTGDIFYLTLNQERFEAICRLYEKSELESLGNEWVPIKAFLPAKLDISDIDYDENIIKTIKYIEAERENILYGGKVPEKVFIVFVPGDDGIVSAVNDMNVGKFLVFLERNNIISDLHLPIFIQETENGEVFNIKSSSHIWLSTTYAIREAIQSPEKFRDEIVRLKIKNWKQFIQVTEQLKKNGKPTEIKSAVGSVKQENVEIDLIQVQTKVGLLMFNKSTGYAKLNEFEALDNLNPQSKEAKTLIKLMSGANYQSKYQDLIGENSSKTSQRNLGFTIRNIKKALGILPKKSAKNKDCIKNIKNYGYRIIA